MTDDGGATASQGSVRLRSGVVDVYGGYVAIAQVRVVENEGESSNK